MRRYPVRINWLNKPSVATPLGAINLNKMDKGLYEIDIIVDDIEKNLPNKIAEQIRAAEDLIIDQLTHGVDDAIENINGYIAEINIVINSANEAADRANIVVDEFEQILDDKFGINDNRVSHLTAWSSYKINEIYNTLYVAMGLMPVDGGTFFEDYIEWENDGGTF